MLVTGRAALQLRDWQRRKKDAGDLRGLAKHYRECTEAAGAAMSVLPSIGDLIRPGMGAALVALQLFLGGAAAGGAEAQPASPLQPVDTSSPRATLQEFRDNMEAAYRHWRAREIAPGLRSLTRGLRTLDLSGVGDALAPDVGTVAGLYLLETIDRVELPVADAIPDAATVEAKGLKRWTIPGTDIVIARVPDGDRAGAFLFTRDTVARARQFYEQVKSLPMLRGAPNMVETWKNAPGVVMPDTLAALVWKLPGWAFSELLNQPLWKWVAALLATALAAGLIYLLLRAGRAWDRRRHRLDGGWESASRSPPSAPSPFWAPSTLS